MLVNTRIKLVTIIKIEKSPANFPNIKLRPIIPKKHNKYIVTSDILISYFLVFFKGCLNFEIIKLVSLFKRNIKNTKAIKK